MIFNTIFPPAPGDDLLGPLRSCEPEALACAASASRAAPYMLILTDSTLDMMISTRGATAEKKEAAAKPYPMWSLWDAEAKQLSYPASVYNVLDHTRVPVKVMIVRCYSPEEEPRFHLVAHSATLCQREPQTFGPISPSALVALREAKRGDFDFLHAPVASLALCSEEGVFDLVADCDALAAFGRSLPRTAAIIRKHDVPFDRLEDGVVELSALPTDDLAEQLEDQREALTRGDAVGRLVSGATIFMGRVGYFSVETMRVDEVQEREMIVFQSWSEPDIVLTDTSLRRGLSEEGQLRALQDAREARTGEL